MMTGFQHDLYEVSSCKDSQTGAMTESCRSRITTLTDVISALRLHIHFHTGLVDIRGGRMDIKLMGIHNLIDTSSSYMDGNPVL